MPTNPKPRIVTAWAEHREGPGWSNDLVTIVLEDSFGKRSEVCLQPEEQTREMIILRAMAQSAHEAMVWAAEHWLREQERN